MATVEWTALSQYACPRSRNLCLSCLYYRRTRILCNIWSRDKGDSTGANWMITYERWREAYLVRYRGALYVNYNSQKLLFPHNACTASEVSDGAADPQPSPLLRPGP